MKEVFLVRDHRLGYLTALTPGQSYTFIHEIKAAYHFKTYPDAQKMVEEVFKMASGALGHSRIPVSLPDPSDIMIKISKIFVHVS